MDTQLGIKAIWGMAPIPQFIHGLPLGKVRLRRRNNQWAKLYVRTKHGIQQFAIAQDSETLCWYAMPIAENRTAKGELWNEELD